MLVQAALDGAPAPARKLALGGTPAQALLALPLSSSTSKKISSTEVRRTPDEITDQVFYW